MHCAIAAASPCPATPRRRHRLATGDVGPGAVEAAFDRVRILDWAERVTGGRCDRVSPLVARPGSGRQEPRPIRRPLEAYSRRSIDGSPRMLIDSARRAFRSAICARHMSRSAFCRISWYKALKGSL